MLNASSNPRFPAIHFFSTMSLVMWWEEQATNLKGKRLDTWCCPSRSHHQLGAANCSDHGSQWRCQCPKTPGNTRRLLLTPKVPCWEAAVWLLVFFLERDNHAKLGYETCNSVLIAVLTSQYQLKDWKLKQRGNSTVLSKARGKKKICWEKTKNICWGKKLESASLSHWTKLFQEVRNEKQIISSCERIHWSRGVSPWERAAAQSGSLTAALRGFIKSKTNTGYRAMPAVLLLRSSLLTALW